MHQFPSSKMLLKRSPGLHVCIRMYLYFSVCSDLYMLVYIVLSFPDCCCWYHQISPAILSSSSVCRYFHFLSIPHRHCPWKLGILFLIQSEVLKAPGDLPTPISPHITPITPPKHRFAIYSINSIPQIIIHFKNLSTMESFTFL